jgi:hypothetical protein
LRLLPLITLAALLIACATTPASAPTSSGNTEPPQLLTRSVVPELTITREEAPSGPLPRLRIQVMVDSLGYADVKTLKLTGIGSGAQNRAAIERWLESVTFRPAMREGRPVSGVFEGTLGVRIMQRPF